VCDLRAPPDGDLVLYGKRVFEKFTPL
jgi:hypothetical protein